MTTLDARERRVLVEVLSGFDDGAVEIINADALAVEKSRNDPALVTLFDQLKADIERRNSLVSEYEKARAISNRASNKTDGLWTDIRTLNLRAAQTRKAIQLLTTRVPA